MHSLSPKIDWLRCALPSALPYDARLRHPFVQQYIQQALHHALVEPRFATPRLSSFFRTQRSLGSKDRRRVQNAVYGLIRHQGILTRADRWHPEQWATTWADMCEGERFLHLSPQDPKEDFACALSLPVEITNYWFDTKSTKECLAHALQLNTPPPMYIRTQNVERGTVQKKLRQDGIHTHIVDDTPHALLLEGRANLLATRSFRNGHIEIQDLSSQQLCTRIASLGETFLDLCAGSGGKSLALAAEGKKVFAHEPRAQAQKELSKRAKRARVRIPIQLPKQHTMDVVLVDAPCSASGRLHRDPALRWRLNPQEDIETQQLLLEQATKFVRKGGYIVYATCSLFEIENQHTPIGWESIEQKHIAPNKQDGFFWNILKQRTRETS